MAIAILRSWCSNPHHIEFQIIADRHGNFIHLGERDCSMQRRNQKIIEECPSPAHLPKMREKMGEASVTLIKAIGYQNAGTIEYLVDEARREFLLHGDEHPHPGGASRDRGSDGLRAHQGADPHCRRGVAFRPRPRRKPRGHSIECRINAEDPYNNFAPSPGTIHLWYAPGGKGVRVDTHVYSGYSVPPYYDSMIAKLIVTGATREIAIARMKRALGEFMIQRHQDNHPLPAGDPQPPGFQKRDVRHRLGRSLP